jgi:uncharacterized protein
MPVEYTVPGVYIEEIPAGSRPIQGVSTAVAAFMGFTYTRPKGNQGQPVAVYSWSQFVEEFCTINYTYKVKEPIDDGKEPNLGEPKQMREVDRRKSMVEIYPDGYYLPHAVFGYFQNGGTRCYVQSLHVVADQEQQPVLQLSDTSTSKLSLKAGYIPGNISGAVVLKIDTVKIDAVPPAEPSQEKEVSGGIPPENPAQGGAEAPASAPPAQPPSGKKAGAEKPGQTNGDLKEQFILTISVDDKVQERFVREGAKGNAAPTKEELLGWLRQSTIIDMPAKDDIALAQAEALLPKNQEYRFVRPQADRPTSAKPFRGNVTERTGFGALEEVSDVTMLICPDLMTAYQTMLAPNKDPKPARDMVAIVQNAMLAHCGQMKDRFAILDSLPCQRVNEVESWRKSEANYSKDDAKYGALYYPWIKIANPNAHNGADQTILVPPSGHIAGLYARVDQERGVHKAPANESIRGAIELERKLIDSEQATLNPIGVNCIRAFPNRGILVWGARTLAEASSEWRYINVRRLFNFVEESIYEGTQWVVFEPNDMDLWERVKRTITAFLTRVWQSGALFGAAPEQAFYVKCDAELNTPAVRDAGQLIVEIGIAPVKPAEFVVFRFRQIPGGEGGVEE